TRTSTFFPFTPPAALASLSASSMAFRVEMPKVASEPVSDPISPIRIVSPLTQGVPPAAGPAVPGVAEAAGGEADFFSQPTRARTRTERMGETWGSRGSKPRPSRCRLRGGSRRSVGPAGGALAGCSRRRGVDQAGAGPAPLDELPEEGEPDGSQGQAGQVER